MKNVSVIPVLALALTFGTATLASAQGTAQRTEQDGTHRRGPGGRGGDNMLLKGITLSSAQQARVKELRTAERKQFEANRPKGQAGANGARVQRERGDTTGFGARRAEMEQHRAQRITAIRSILDARQRTQFDKNVAEMKAHAGERRGGGQFGGTGRGARTSQPGQ